MNMAWALLGIAGILEIAFAYSMKSSDGFTRLIPGLLTVATGMLTSTCLAVLFVPAFYVVLQRWVERKRQTKVRPA